MSYPLTFNNCIAPDVKNITLPTQTIISTDETTIANLTLNINSTGSKVYLAADITFIFVNFAPEAVPSEYLTFRFYNGDTLLFEKEIFCSNHVILEDGPSLVYVYEPTEANFFCVNIPPFTTCDCDKSVTYTLTVQVSMLEEFEELVITPDNSTSTFLAIEYS